MKKLKKSIKQEETKFMEIFNRKAKDYNSFLSALRHQTFQEEVVLGIVEQFDVEDNFKDVMVLIIRDCLTNYQEVFLKTISEKEGIQLIVLLQGLNLDVILKSIENLKESIKLELKQKIEKEAGEGKETIEPKKIGKQIKILSITASPEGENYILYEQEQDTLLDAFKSFDREQVFLDMPDPVKSTLKEIQEHLEDGKHDILHITAHGGINDKGEGVLSLEDHQGNLDEVTGKELINVLNPKPKIVILSACHSARKEPDLMPAARILHEKGIETVIGMKKRVSHAAAVEFNLAFFNALCQKETVKQAFDKGKEAIFTGEQQRIKEMPGWDAVKEYEIPQLLAKDENITVDNFSDFRIEAPGRPESHHFLGARYLERGFIGRRQVLRDIFKSIDNKEGAVVLKGPGGIGKSTLTTRTAANLRRKGYEFIVVRGDTTIEQILEAISKKAAALGVKDAEKVYAANAEPNEKLAWYLDQFLVKQQVVLILDNFEENQDEEQGGAFKRERLENFLWFFRDSLKHHDTFLFFSTRYALPGFDSPDITRNIPEFSPVEFRKMLLNSKALKSLDSRSVKTLIEEIGGNPRALDLLDRIAYEEFKQREFTWEQLKDLFPEMRERIIDKEGKGDEFTPLFLDRLLGYLSPSQHQLLDVLSIYRNLVPAEAITVHNVNIERKDRRKLSDLSLLECFDLEDKELYYVHRLTAQYLLEQMKGAERKRYFKTAAGYFEALQDEEGKILLDDLIEARWHYIQAGELNKAAEITFDLEGYLRLRGYPHRAMELLQALELKKLKDKNKSTANNRIGILFQNFGEYEKALCHFKKALEINEKNNDEKGASANLHQIGMIYQDKGDYEAALNNYQKSMEIKEKIGNIAGAALSNAQMGTLYFKQNKFETALKFFVQAFLVFAKIGSPYANQSKKDITRVREKLPEDQFNAILKEFKLPTDFLDKIEAADQQKQLMAFLTAITKDAVSASASEKSSDEKEKLVDQLNNYINQLSDKSEEEDPLNLKYYFQMLLAMVNGEEYQAYMEKIPEELKELFEKVKDKSD